MRCASTGGSGRRSFVNNVARTVAAAGQHAVVLKATDTKTNPVRLEDLVIVKTGQIESVPFSIPDPNSQ